MPNTVLSHVVNTLEHLAPAILSEEWDNTGLLLGDLAAPIERIMTCLTLTEEVAQEAVTERAQLVVTHHPLMFRPLQKITTSDAQGRILSQLLRHQIAVFSPHTRWDNSSHGINQQLAQACGLQQIAPLRESFAATHSQLVTFVPPEHLSSVRQALWNAGGGQIGEYSCCSYAVQGVGTFLGSEVSQPSVGTPGHLEEVGESRLELLVPTRDLPRILSALRDSHPYEEPAYFVYPLVDAAGVVTLGRGRCGELHPPLTVLELSQRLCTALNLPGVEIVGEPGKLVNQVGIACGAAAEFLSDARRRGCQVFITGEARFHDLLKAREFGVHLILLGHYGSERPGMERLAKLLYEHHPECQVWASRAEQNPLQWIAVTRT